MQLSKILQNHTENYCVKQVAHLTTAQSKNSNTSNWLL